jgi:hypothetical protein
LKSAASRDSIALDDKIRVEGEEYIPAILFNKLVTHVLGEFLEHCRCQP